MCKSKNHQYNIPKDLFVLVENIKSECEQLKEITDKGTFDPNYNDEAIRKITSFTKDLPNEPRNEEVVILAQELANEMKQLTTMMKARRSLTTELNQRTSSKSFSRDYLKESRKALNDRLASVIEKADRLLSRLA